MRTDILERKDEIIQWISEIKSKAYICRELKCKPETLNFWLDKMGIEYKGNQSCVGIKKNMTKRVAEEYAKSDTCRSVILKQKLIEEGILDDVCVKCGNDGQWMGQKITLELDHIDGDRFNNSFDNLRILCPNCHSQTDTFRNRGKKVKHYCECGNEKQKHSKLCVRCHHTRNKK